jgi:ABC-type glycerol-3-phosphate transport system substrate-binding protein
MTRRSTRRVAAGFGIAAVLSMGALTACGGGESTSPSGTTTTTTSTPAPTEKSINPTGGNSFSPPVKAPPAPTAIPGTHN